MEISGVGLGYNGISSTAGASQVAQNRPQDNETPEVTGVVQAQDQVERQPIQTDKGGKTGEDKGDNREATDDQIKQAVSEINKRAVESEAVFGIHEKTNRVTIKIVDKKTKDVIKEIPAEKTLDLIAKAWEMAGLLVDEKR